MEESNRSSAVFGDRLLSIRKKNQEIGKSKSISNFDDEIEDTQIHSSIKQITNFWEKEKEKKESKKHKYFSCQNFKWFNPFCKSYPKAKFGEFLNFFKTKFPNAQIEKNPPANKQEIEEDYRIKYNRVLIDLRVSEKLIQFLLEENIRLKNLNESAQLQRFFGRSSFLLFC